MKRFIFIVCMCCILSAAIAGMSGVKVNAGEFAWVTASGGEEPKEKDLKGVFHYGNFFIAVGTKGTIKMSYDGRGWENRESGTDMSLYGASWNGSLFIVVGDQGTILTSYDGKEWKKSMPVTAANLTAALWDKNKFVVVGEKGTILNSPDGITWSKAECPSKAHLKGVAANSSLLVAVGDHSTIMTSIDGIVWKTSKYKEGEESKKYVLENIIWTGESFFIGGYKSSDEIFPVLLESTDTQVWIENVIDNLDRENIAGVHLKALSWDGTQVIAVGDKGKVFMLPSCHRCRKVETISSEDLTGIVKHEDKLVVVGSSGTVLTASLKNIRITVDGNELQPDISVVVTKNNRILIPYNDISSICEVSFDETNRSIAVYREKLDITMKIDDDIAYVNGEKKLLDAMPAYISGKAYIPLRFVFESLRYNVSWDENSNTAAVSSYAAVNSILPEEALHRISSGAFLIDVRTPEEYRTKHIKGSINIPLDELESRVATLVKNRNEEIILYCATGKRSRKAAELLVKSGYTEIFDLGGIVAWPYETEDASRAS